jgi:hypothetical protein
MSVDARGALENLNPLQAQAIINGDGKACPMVTSGHVSHYSDTGDPYVVASCSDGNRYVVFWDTKDGALDALSCSWAGC